MSRAPGRRKDQALARARSVRGGVVDATRRRAHGPTPARQREQRGAMSTWVVSRFPVYARAWVIVAVFLAPVAVLRTAVYPALGVKAAALWVCGLAALALWLSTSAERRSWPPRLRLIYPAAAFLVASMLATALSLSPLVSLVGFDRYAGLLPRLLYAAIALAVVGVHWERPAGLRQIAWASGAGAVVLACAVVLQQAGIDRILWAGPVPGTVFDFPPGTMGFSNFAGGYLGIAAPFLVYLAISTRRLVGRCALGAGLGLVLVAVWYTQSRGGMIAAVVGLGVMALASRPGPSRWAKRAVALAAALVAVASVVVVWHPGADAPPEQLAGIEQLRTKTLGFRLAYWSAAGRIFADHPGVGTGLDTFYAYYPRYRAADAKLDAQSVTDGSGTLGYTYTDQPHNIFLGHASNSGALGVGSYLLLVGLALRYGLRRARILEAGPRLLLAAFLGVLAAYLAQGFFSIDEPALAAIGWVAIGGIAAMADPAAVAARQQGRAGPDGQRYGARSRAGGGSPQVVARRRRARWLVHGAGAVVVGAVLVVGLRPVHGDVEAGSGRWDEAMRLNPLNPLYPGQAGLQAERLAQASPTEANKLVLLREARRQHLRALHLQPRSMGETIAMATLETYWAQSVDPGRFVEAEGWWKRVMDQEPANAALRAAAQRQLAGAKARAVTRLRVATSIRPDDVGSWVDLAKAHLALGESGPARTALERALSLDPTSIEARRLLADLQP